MGKYILALVVIAVLVFLLAFHVILTDSSGIIILAKQSPSFAYTVISLDDFLDRWNGMTIIEKTQSGPLSYIKYELTWRKVVVPVK